jgi:hypothetical protein
MEQPELLVGEEAEVFEEIEEAEVDGGNGASNTEARRHGDAAVGRRPSAGRTKRQRDRGSKGPARTGPLASVIPLPFVPREARPHGLVPGTPARCRTFCEELRASVPPC